MLFMRRDRFQRGEWFLSGFCLNHANIVGNLSDVKSSKASESVTNRKKMVGLEGVLENWDVQFNELKIYRIAHFSIM